MSHLTSQFQNIDVLRVIPRQGTNVQGLTVEEIRVTLDLPRTGTMMDNLNAALANLVAEGKVVRQYHDDYSPSEHVRVS